ncbi:hypothetical protein Tco_0408019 [Tanacetum coccineum]
MSHSTISIPSDSTGESVGSSASLVILSNTKAKVMAILAVLPEITLEAKAAVVASPTPILDVVIESDPEAEPYEALLSLDYVPASPIHAPASPDYHPGSNKESKPFEDESEVPIKDITPEAAEPLPAQVAPPLPVQITPTSPTEPAFFGPSRKRCRSPPPASAVPPPDVPSPRRRSSLPAAASAPIVLSLVPADCLPPHKRFRGLPTISYKDATVETTVKPVVPSVHHG